MEKKISLVKLANGLGEAGKRRVASSCIFMFTAGASPLGKVHGKDMGQQGPMSQELVSVGLVNKEVVYGMQTYLGET